MDPIFAIVIIGLIMALGVMASAMWESGTINELENISLDENLRGLTDEKYSPTMSPNPTGETRSYKFKL